jgi:putative ABC transport system permease protein
MTWLQRIRARLRQRELEQRMDAEMRFHLEMATRENIAAGMTPESAGRAARVSFGGVEQVKEVCREQRRLGWIEDVGQDVRLAGRLLRKSPGFTAAALVTLALGIGATTAIFSVVDGVLLRPLPYPESERLVRVGERFRNSYETINYPNFRDWQAQQTVFQGLAVWRRASANLTGGGEPLRLPVVQVSGGLFPLLGLHPQLGRTITAADDAPGAPAVAVLAHGLWQRRFGSDPAALGRSITLDGRPHAIVGVMPADFPFPGELWQAVGPVAAGWTNRGERQGLRGIARLRPGVGLVEARAAMDTIAARLEKVDRNNEGVRIGVDPLLDSQVGHLRRSLGVLLGAALLVLAIACANVAALLLARAVVRGREMAVRAALGAGRGRLVRQLLTESLLLSAGGCLGGVLLAHLALEPLLALAAAGQLPRLQEVGIDGRVLTFSLAVALGTGLLFGLAPAWQIGRADLQASLREAAGRTTAARTPLRQGLLVGQVALTLVLLVGAGLLLKSFYRLQQVEAGYQAERVLAFRLNLPARKYPSLGSQLTFYRQLQERLRVLPGVQSASLASQIPLDESSSDMTFFVDGQPEPPAQQQPVMETHVVGLDYFRTLGIPLLRGRLFAPGDDRGHLPAEQANSWDSWVAGIRVVVIDEELARRHWPGQDPIGQRIRLPWGPRAQQPVMTVVGVVGHVKLDRLREPDAKPQAYFPFLQAPQGEMTVVLKTALPPETVVAAARAAVQALDPDQPNYGVRTLSEMRARNVAPERLQLLLLGIFAAAALVLATVGLYALLAYSVAQRRREIGVRLALGARRAQVSALVLRQGLTLALAGIAVGLGGVLATTHLLRTLLFQVSPADPAIVGSVTALVLSVTAAAALLPARRAANLDPMAALRQD